MQTVKIYDTKMEKSVTGWDGEIVTGWTNKNLRNLQVEYFVPQTNFLCLPRNMTLVIDVNIFSSSKLRNFAFDLNYVNSYLEKQIVFFSSLNIF